MAEHQHLTARWRLAVAPGQDLTVGPAHADFQHPHPRLSGRRRRVGDLGDLRPRALEASIGGGVRVEVDRAERVHLRADLAASRDDHGLYVTILEAF